MIKSMSMQVVLCIVCSRGKQLSYWIRKIVPIIKYCEYFGTHKLSDPSLHHKCRAIGERLRERTSFQGYTGVLTIAVWLVVALGREVKDFKLYRAVAPQQHHFSH